jgi:hypothetical protein
MGGYFLSKENAMWKTGFAAAALLWGATLAFGEGPETYVQPAPYVSRAQPPTAVVVPKTGEQVPSKGEKNPTILFHISVIELSITKLEQQGIEIADLLSADSPDSATKEQKSSPKKNITPGNTPPLGGNYPMFKSDDKFCPTDAGNGKRTYGESPCWK